VSSAPSILGILTNGPAGRCLTGGGGGGCGLRAWAGSSIGGGREGEVRANWCWPGCANDAKGDLEGLTPTSFGSNCSFHVMRRPLSLRFWIRDRWSGCFCGWVRSRSRDAAGRAPALRPVDPLVSEQRFTDTYAKGAESRAIH